MPIDLPPADVDVPVTVSDVADVHDLVNVNSTVTDVADVAVLSDVL